MTNKSVYDRRERMMPGGVPRWVRVYDNGGGHLLFCRSCLLFQDERQMVNELGFAPRCGDRVLCPEQGCGRPMVWQPAKSGSFDRYTVVYTGNFKGRPIGYTFYRGMSCRPSHPQGFGLWGEHQGSFDTVGGFPPKIGDRAPWGNGDSRRITFLQLPEDCKKLVLEDYNDLWRLDFEQADLKLMTDSWKKKD